MRYFAPDGGVSMTDAYLYAGGLSALAIIIGIIHHPYFYKIQKLGMNIRIAVCSMIYTKVRRTLSILLHIHPELSGSIITLTVRNTP